MHLMSCFSQMSAQSMVEDIMSGLTSATEPQVNVMHTTYLLMQCCSESSAFDVAIQFSSQLHLKYFTEQPKVISFLFHLHTYPFNTIVIHFIDEEYKRHVPPSERDSVDGCEAVDKYQTKGESVCQVLSG